MASFFPQGFYGPADVSFTPLFRLLDDFDTYSRGQAPAGGRHHRGTRLSTFHPRFDVRETDTSYELHGELAGLDKKDIHIEFTDPQTMVVRGRIERSYTSGTPPAGLVEDAAQPAAITEEGEHHDKEHQPTVQDEEDAKKAEEVGTEVVEPKPADKAKYWVSERSVGEFSRSFHFPSRVDQDAVNASLKNGILSIEVPKAKKHESRRIAIE